MNRQSCIQCSEPASWESLKCRSCGYRFLISHEESADARRLARLRMAGLAFAAVTVAATACRAGLFSW